jgi:hypothetical protein
MLPMPRRSGKVSDVYLAESSRVNVIDVYQAVQHGDQRFDLILRTDDKIYVHEARPSGLPPIQIATP